MLPPTRKFQLSAEMNAKKKILNSLKISNARSYIYTREINSLPLGRNKKKTRILSNYKTTGHSLSLSSFQSGIEKHAASESLDSFYSGAISR